MEPMVTKNLDNLAQQVSSHHNLIRCTGVSGSDRAYIVSGIRDQVKLPMVVVVDTTKQMDRFVEDLEFFLRDDIPVLKFPDYNLLPFKRLSYHGETATARIRTLYQLMSAESPPILVTTVGAMMHRMVPKNDILDYAELVLVNEDIDRDRLVEKLISGGYVRTGIVEEPGDFSVRGGILDIFSPLYPEPLRVELFGDTVESIRFFSAVNQRKLDDVFEAVVLPAKEVILRKSEMAAIVSRVRQQAANLEIPVTRVREIVDRISKEGIFSGIESLIPLVYPEPGTLMDYFPSRMLCILAEPEELAQAADQYEKLTHRNYQAAFEEKRLCVEPEKLYMAWADVKKNLQVHRNIHFEKLNLYESKSTAPPKGPTCHFNISDNSDLTLSLKQTRGKDRALAPLVSWISTHRQAGNKTFLLCSTSAQAHRLESLLLHYDLSLPIWPDFNTARKEKDPVSICIGQLESGFIWPEEHLAFLKEDEIFGKKHHRPPKTKTRVRTDLIPIEDLKKDDLIVHLEHGIGRYEGLTKLKLNGTTNDFLLIIYKDGDRLYLPVDRMSQIQKYMGVDGFTPVLDKMGGKSWDKVKTKVKKSAEKIAGELLKLYAERKIRAGFAFEKVDELYQDFESGFPYDETEDQTKAIDHVLEDMMAETPMDRLICGDVGYGKTEVALRASFFAVHNGKQVAVLVPTTVLAEQHYDTFKTRFEPFAVNVACLSRFKSPKEQKQIIEEVQAGKVDIVVGTHRLLQKDVGFKSLGLFVIDEEQRFGVKHKEKLKQIRTTVDVLALTATPIPRTLHMSLLGIRDISVISTPPEFRRAIITYVSEFEDEIVVDAIRKEISRNGQVYFVHNNINTIQRMSNKIKTLVPEVKLEVAHGRMKEDELEDVMFKFVQKEIDLLVCTTIIESGLDIPAANTIIVNRADRFGLSQMYQLRGRVGRADEQAYAYLFIPKDSVLGKDARKRLKVLMEHSDLGAGFQIAMSDLKIRGGGTILGASQSGHIASVGYDMFLKLMEESISKIKGEPVLDDLDPEINVTISAFIPESYISDIDQRLSAYRRLTRMTDLKEISEFKTELIDRFGPLPAEGANLLLKIMLKVLAKKAGMKRLDLNGQELQLHISEIHQNNPYGIVEMLTSEEANFQLSPDRILKARLTNQNVSGLLVETKNILQEIARRVNPEHLKT